MSSLLYLSSKNIRQAANMKSMIAAMEDAFVSLSTGSAIIPQRVHTNIVEKNATALFMPAYDDKIGQIGFKLVSVNNNNPLNGLPLIHAMVMLIDANNGLPLALMNGADITALRTGAASGLATKLLSNIDSKVVAIFGAGAQGKTQLEAVCAVREIEHAYVFDPSVDYANKFISEMETKLSIKITHETNQSVLTNADIICAATTSMTPVFNNENLKKGVHINGVGSYKPDMQEIPVSTLKNARVFVDKKEACLKEAGDLIIPISKGEYSADSIGGELGEIITGKVEGRIDIEQITVFKSVGSAIQDLYATSVLYSHAIKQEIGVKLEL